MEASELLASVLALDSSIVSREKSDRPSVSVPVEVFPRLMSALKGDSHFSFDMLCAHTAIDWPAQEKLELVYQLYSTSKHHYLMVSLYLPRTGPVAPSVCAHWQIAEWQEREVYDMFGVMYSGHPDLRRLLLEDDWKGFPLRKDYQDDFMLERPW